MNVVFLILYLAAGVCFGLAAANTERRYNLVALGLLAWVLVDFIQAVQKL